MPQREANGQHTTSFVCVCLFSDQVFLDWLPTHSLAEDNLGPSCLPLSGVGLTGMCHQAQLIQSSRDGTQSFMAAEQVFYQVSYVPGWGSL